MALSSLLIFMSSINDIKKFPKYGILLATGTTLPHGWVDGFRGRQLLQQIPFLYESCGPDRPTPSKPGLELDPFIDIFADTLDMIPNTCVLFSTASSFLCLGFADSTLSIKSMAIETSDLHCYLCGRYWWRRLAPHDPNDTRLTRRGPCFSDCCGM